MIHVYIDESGIFLPLERRKPKVSAVAALFCSSRVVNALFAEFARLAASFPTMRGEVKGSTLDEAQVASVIQTLEKYDVLVEAQVIDAGWHRERDITAFRQRQASFIGRHALGNDDPRVRELAGRLQSHVERMPNQLFMQAWMTLVLVERVIQTAIWYYSLNGPRELAGFAWTIDAKEAGGLTAAEDFWTEFVVPYAENRSRVNPVGLLYDGDHSAMGPSMTVNADRTAGSLSIRSLLTDHITFKDSASDPGLQLVDIVANAVTRAFNGSLGEAGWGRIPYLLAGIEPQVIQYGRMVPQTPRVERRIPLTGDHARIMARLYSRRRLVHQGTGPPVPALAKW